MKRPILLKFAKRVRAERKRLGLSQEEFAAKSGFHRTCADAEEAVPELIKFINQPPASFIDRIREMRNWRAHTSRRTIRFNAAAALSVISPSTPEILPALIEMTQDWEYRWLGITSMGKIGCYAASALPVLQKFLTSRHQMESKAAVEATAKIREAENKK